MADGSYCRLEEESELCVPRVLSTRDQANRDQANRDQTPNNNNKSRYLEISNQ